MTLETIRNTAQKAFMAGVASADPNLALDRALKKEPLQSLNGGKYIIISIGKAACKMAECALSHLPEGADFSAIAVTNYENVCTLEGCRVLGAAHPVPDDNGLKASKEVIAMLSGAKQGDVVLALVSGGSSALLPAPVDGITLHDKSEVNEVLLSAGLDIYEMNLIRQSLSKLKGGGLLGFADPAEVRSYILSDVLGDDLKVVGSGPSIGPIGTVADARRLMIEAGIFTKMPASVRTFLENENTAKSVYNAKHAVLIGGNTQSVIAMAQSLDAEVIAEPLEGDVQTAADVVLAEINKRNNRTPFAIAFGGETTVRITGSGKGGRNQELALRVADVATKAGLKGNWCFLSGGTDGRDGPTDAAGGLVDPNTIDRIQNKGGVVADFLQDNDSYNALLLSDDLLMTGATGTNVADLQLFIMA